MIVCNGLVGICIFIGGLRYREQDFQVAGANLYLTVLFAMATIALVLPNYTLTTPGPVFSEAQLEFVSVVTILLYGVFLYTQTIRHRDYFVGRSAEGDEGVPISGADLRAEHAHLRHRADQYPVWAGSHGGVRGVRVHGIRPLAHDPEKACPALGSRGVNRFSAKIMRKRQVE
jgi:Ca2+/H+ antiporter